MKTLLIVGARPQFVKAAPMIDALKRQPGNEVLLLDSGQHYDENMAGVFFKELGLPKPDFSLGIGSGSHGAQTGRMLEAIEKVLLEVKPDWTVVFGDTNTTIAGALAAVKLHFPLAHIEAGLRSYDRRMPEEVNRVLADCISDICFAPSESSRANLLKEGVAESRVMVVGDVMVDALNKYGAIADENSEVLSRYGLEPKGYLLCTLHRASNTDDPSILSLLMETFMEIGSKMPLVLPLHPRTREALRQINLLEEVERKISVLPPASYLDMLKLEKSAKLIATDSGGVQKEAYIFGVPCVTLRSETEWVELVEAGWNRLAPPTTKAEVVDAVLEELARETRPARPPIYGEGDASGRIADCLAFPLTNGASSSQRLNSGKTGIQK